MPKQAKLLSKGQIHEFFSILAANIVPESELKWGSNLDLVIAVVLSAQCTDKAVNKATAALFKKCRTTADYITLGEENLREAIRSIGLYKNKAKNIIGLCERIQTVFGDVVPDNREDLQSLTGVGRKTANVVLNVAFGQATMAVDTHIFRVSNRIGLVHAKNPDQTELKLLKRIPDEFLKDAHHYLILHGRYTCVARTPKCEICKVAHVCNALEKQL